MTVDKETVKKRFGKGIATYEKHAVVQKRICKKLTDCLKETAIASCKNFLEVGCGSGLLTNEILKSIHPEKFYVNDIVPETKVEIETVFKKHYFSQWTFLEGDAEKIDFPDNLDLVLSTSTLQWFNSLSSFFHKVHGSLKSNGIFAFSTFGPENFKEIRTTLNIGLHYHHKNNLLLMLVESFDILHIHEYDDILCFQDPFEVLKHIKYIGANGINVPSLSRKDLRHFEKEYYKRNCFYEKGHVTLTYQPIIVIAKKNNGKSIFYQRNRHKLW